MSEPAEQRPIPFTEAVMEASVELYAAYWSLCKLVSNSATEIEVSINLDRVLVEVDRDPRLSIPIKDVMQHSESAEGL